MPSLMNATAWIQPRSFLDSAPEGCIAMVFNELQNTDGFDNRGKMCPVLDDPQPNCYCIDMTSMKILYAVKYCLRDFRACEIYQRLFKKD
jgi:hypothetical protein